MLYSNDVCGFSISSRSTVNAIFTVLSICSVSSIFSVRTFQAFQPLSFCTNKAILYSNLKCRLAVSSLFTYLLKQLLIKVGRWRYIAALTVKTRRSDMQRFHNRCCPDSFRWFCIITEKRHFHSTSSEFCRQHTACLIKAKNSVVGELVLSELYHLMQRFPAVIKYKVYLYKSRSVVKR